MNNNVWWHWVYETWFISFQTLWFTVQSLYQRAAQCPKSLIHIKPGQDGAEVDIWAVFAETENGSPDGLCEFSESKFCVCGFSSLINCCHLFPISPRDWGTPSLSPSSSLLKHISISWCWRGGFDLAHCLWSLSFYQIIRFTLSHSALIFSLSGRTWSNCWSVRSVPTSFMLNHVYLISYMH